MVFCRSVTWPVLLLRASVMASLRVARSAAEIARLAAGGAALGAAGAAAAGTRDAVLTGAPAPMAGCGRARGRGIRFGPPGRVLAGPLSGVFSAIFSGTFSAAFSFGL